MVTEIYQCTFCLYICVLVEKSRFPTGVENVGVGGGGWGRRGIGGAGGFSKFDGEGGA